MQRTLSLKTERLAELTPAELTAVAGGEISGLVCKLSDAVAACQQPSDWIMSLCGCLTNYCSIDVC